MELRGQDTDLILSHPHLAARDRLEGWPQARFRARPSFETARPLKKRAPPRDEGRDYGTLPRMRNAQLMVMVLLRIDERGSAVAVARRHEAR